MVVVTMSVGTLLVLIDANTKQQKIQSIITNITFALDSMTREIRTGQNYYCINNLADTAESNGSATRDCATGANSLVITESGGSLTNGLGSGTSKRIAYRYNATNKSIERRLADTGIWQSITAPEVTITTLDFIVTGTDRLPTDERSPTVTIYIEGKSNSTSDTDSTFQMQTTVTQKILDI